MPLSLMLPACCDCSHSFDMKKAMHKLTHTHANSLGGKYSQAAISRQQAMCFREMSCDELQPCSLPTTGGSGSRCHRKWQTVGRLKAKSFPFLSTTLSQRHIVALPSFVRQRACDDRFTGVRQFTAGNFRCNTSAWFGLPLFTNGSVNAAAHYCIGKA